MANEEKSQAKLLKEKLMMNKENGSKRVSAKEVAQADDFCEEYKDFLNKAKTEREAVAYAIQIAKENGFTEYSVGTEYKAGDKVYVK